MYSCKTKYSFFCNNGPLENFKIYWFMYTMKGKEYPRCASLTMGIIEGK
jgi:hypothetical protein